MKEGKYTGSIIGTIILSIAASVSFVLSYRQYNEKEPLLNNAYIYASEPERKKISKKPYFRQSSIIFLLVGIIFLILAVDMLLKTTWLVFCSISVAVAAIIYSVISSSKIEREKGAR